MTKHTAGQVADWLLMWADHNDANISNLKLQKLLYYAQGHHLASFRAPLFDDPIQAWAHGPVVPSVYGRIKKYGNGAVDVSEAVASDFDWEQFRDIEDHLMRIWNTYGKYEAWALRERTHRETPWVSTFQHDLRHLVIPQEKMRDFFASA